MQNRISLIALFTSAAALMAAPAFAQDANAFGQRLVDILSASGLEMSFANATADGDTIVLSDFTITAPGEDPIDLPGDLTFTGVAEAADGSFTAETATIADIAFADDDVSITAANFLVEDITLPADYSPSSVSSMLLYRRASAGPMSVAMEGTEIFTLDNFSAETTGDETEITSGYEMSGLMINVEALMAEMDEEEAAEAQQVFEAFDIDQLVANFSGSGTWRPQSGEAELTDLRFDFADLGALSLSGSFTGYTAELYGEMIKMQQKLAASVDTMSEQELQAVQDASLAMLADVGVVSFSVRYDDASLFNKSLAFAAAEQGIDATTLAAGLQFMVPMMLTELQNPEFSAAVTQAVNAFVANPQNFTISANPTEPLYVNDFVGIEEDPFAAIDLLGLTVTANQ